MGNLVRVTEPNPNPQPGDTAPHETTYTYDVFNRLKEVRMARVTLLNPLTTTTQVRTWNYDPTTQRLISVNHPETGTVTYTYNLDGTVNTRTDAKGQSVVYGYDSYQRAITIDRYLAGAGVPDPCQSVRLSYDTGTIPGFANGLGRVTAAQWGRNASGQLDPSCSWAFREDYGYWNNGLLTIKRLTLAQPNTNGVEISGYLEAGFGYDQEGRLMSHREPVTNHEYIYERDALGRATKLKWWSGVMTDVVTDITYGPGNELLQMKYGGYTETRAYNPLLQMRRLTASGAGLPTVDLEYVYPGTSNNGRISQTINYASGETVSYQYDALNRLISASASGSQTWSMGFGYDGFGNRKSQGGSSWVYDGQTNRLGSGYTYDANGNLTAGPGMGPFTYDVDNRLASAPGESYLYGWNNERLCKAGCAEVYFYGATGERLGTFQALNNNVQIYFQKLSTDLYFEGKLVKSQNQWVVVDRLGSVRSRLGAPAETFDYYPYGEEKPSATVHNRPKFGTYYRDATGLDYAMNRYYSSQLARFMTPDPSEPGDLTNPQSFNLYSYVLGDPINYNDPEGLLCRNVGLFGWSGIRNGTTVVELISQRTDVSAFAQTIFTETRVAADDLASREKGAVAKTIMNRWQFVNGYYTLYDRPVGPRRGRPRVVPDWGRPDGTLTSIVFAEHQFEPWVDDWMLGPAEQGRLNSALNSTEFSNECTSLLQSIGTAALFWESRNIHGLYVSDNDLIFTSFAAPARGNLPNKAYYETWIGSFGTGNQFSGVSPAQVGPLASLPGKRTSLDRVDRPSLLYLKSIYN